MTDSGDNPGEGDLFGGNLPSLPASRLSLVKRRLIHAAAVIQDSPAEDVSYQHSVLCQTALPVRRPPPSVRTWDRRQGRAALSIEAGRANDPARNCWVNMPLPFGPKARLVMMHLNSEAIRSRSPEIEVDRSMTAFIRRLMPQRNDPNGREIRAFKEQLAALASATVRLSFTQGERSRQVNTQIVGSFDLWFPKDERQHVMWPSTVQLSQEYFDSLLSHAVPLDERAISSLSHSAVALDVYAWLAQRLHRIPVNAPQLVSWPALHEQFGKGNDQPNGQKQKVMQGFTRLRDFRNFFLNVLTQVGSAYPDAQFSTDERGLTLTSSRPPVSKRLHTLPSHHAN